MTYLVAGLARTGQSVIRMARRDGDDVIGYDDDEATAQRVTDAESFQQRQHRLRRARAMQQMASK